MLINVGEELNAARKRGYAIGAFNTNNLEVTKAIASSAKKNDGIVIVQTTPSAMKYAGLAQIFSIVKNEIDSCGIKGAIHLDHAKDFETVREAIDVGYKSVMIDGSALPFSENVALTRKVVEYAHPKNVTVEGEIGLLGVEEGGEMVTDRVLSSPEQTNQFVELTGIDSVAVSLGNQHGAPTGEKIDLDLLERIANVVKIPLVLHGSSGLDESEIKRAISLGVAKINVDTLIRRAFIEGMSQKISGATDYRDIFLSGMERVEDVVSHKIKLFSAANEEL